MNESTAKIVTIIIFVLTYLGILIFSKRRAYIALGAALLLVILKIMPINSVIKTIDWNILLMLAGIMGTMALFIESKMPAVIGDWLMAKSANLKWAIIFLALLAGIISAFVDNVATVIMLAPIAVLLARKINVSPVPIIIAISISSNLQGAATLIGDTTSILLGAEANMNFFDFFFMKGRIGLFFVVQVSALLATGYLLFLFRKKTQKFKIEEKDKEKVQDIVPTILLVSTLILLVVASFFQNKLELTNGIICTSIFLVGLIYHIIRYRDKKKSFNIIKNIDFITISLLAGLFLVIGSLEKVGLIEDIAEQFAKISDNRFIIYTIIVFASVLLSAFIDNIPYVATMLPVVTAIALNMGVEPYLFYFGLISGATLGGNLTPIGASANIAALGILRKEGYETSIKEFIRISIPFTLIAVLSGYVMILFLWY